MFVRNQHKLTLTPQPLGQRSETVRRSNLSTIVRELHLHGALTRSELVARTGLTRTAIRALIGELVAAGLVSEERASSRGVPGRPSPVVRANSSAAVVLALEIAVDSLAVALVGLGGEMLDVVRVDRPRGRFSVDETVADLAELARVVQDRQVAAKALIGVGVGVVGIVRRTDGFVSVAPNLGWHDVPLGERLAAALRTNLPVAVANEADLGALAELRRGAAINAGHVLFISGEVGVGGGVIVDGTPLTGAAGFGGEVGHMLVNPNGTPCRCGSVGCWETEVGEGALLLRAGHSPGGGRGEVDEVLREAAEGSPAALRALDHVGRWLGIGLASLVNIFNPRLIVLGGLFGRTYRFTAPTLLAEIDRLALRGSRELVEVVPATLGMDAPLLGAAELALEPLLADPQAWAPVLTLAPNSAIA